MHGDIAMLRQRIRHIAHDPAGHLRLFANRDAIQEHIPAGGLLDRGNDAHGGRLAGAIRSHEAEDMAGIEREGDIVDREGPAEFFPQVFDWDFHGESAGSTKPNTTAEDLVRFGLEAEPSPFSIKGFSFNSAIYEFGSK